VPLKKLRRQLTRPHKSTSGSSVHLSSREKKGHSQRKKDVPKEKRVFPKKKGRSQRKSGRSKKPAVALLAELQWRQLTWPRKIHAAAASIAVASNVTLFFLNFRWRITGDVPAVESKLKRHCQPSCYAGAAPCGRMIFITFCCSCCGRHTLLACSFCRCSINSCFDVIRW